MPIYCITTGLFRMKFETCVRRWPNEHTNTHTHTNMKKRIRNYESFMFFYVKSKRKKAPKSNSAFTAWAKDSAELAFFETPRQIIIIWRGGNTCFWYMIYVRHFPEEKKCLLCVAKSHSSGFKKTYRLMNNTEFYARILNIIIYRML